MTVTRVATTVHHPLTSVERADIIEIFLRVKLFNVSRKSGYNRNIFKSKIDNVSRKSGYNRNIFKNKIKVITLVERADIIEIFLRVKLR